MAKRDYFSHTIKGTSHNVFWYMQHEYGYCFKLAGENIGTVTWAGASEEDATKWVFDQFMNSSGHRENIMGKAWDVVAVGAYKTHRRQVPVDGPVRGRVRLGPRRDAEADPEADAEADPEADPQGDAEAHPQAHPQADAEADPEADAEPPTPEPDRASPTPEPTAEPDARADGPRPSA